MDENMILKRGRVIAEGTYGRVHEAVLMRDGDDDQNNVDVVAVKSSVSSQSSSLRREKAIFQYLGERPEIVKCFGSYSSTEDDGSSRYNLVLEYAAGGSLTALMKRRGRKLCEIEAKHYIRMLIRGLWHIHKMGVVHCDVKPDNILVFPGGGGDGGNAVKLADFGLAKRLAVEEEEPPLWVQYRGSPAYMPPEALAWEEYEAPMDIWALGCTFVEMVTGELVWRGKAAREIYERVVIKREAPEIPEDGVSECGRDFLRRCFEWDPRSRWTAERMLEERHPFVADSCIDNVEDEGRDEEEEEDNFWEEWLDGCNDEEDEGRDTVEDNFWVEWL